MTMIADENPRHEASDFRAVGHVAIRTSELRRRPIAYVDPPIPYLRDLDRVRDLLPSSHVSGAFRELMPLTRGEGYSWFSDAHRLRAQAWFDTILETARSYNLALAANETARQSVGFLVSAICDLQQQDIDLRHRSRAEEAARRIPGSPTPVRREQIPRQVRDGQGREYELSLASLSWSPGTPAEATDRLAELSRQAMPDRWWLAMYELPRRKTLVATYDPLIYAQYGDWFVKVAEWL